jgi:hypothetical protein
MVLNIDDGHVYVCIDDECCWRKLVMNIVDEKLEMIVDELYFSVWIYAVSSHMFMYKWLSPIGDGGLIGKITPTSKWQHMHIEFVSRTCIWVFMKYFILDYMYVYGDVYMIMFVLVILVHLQCWWEWCKDTLVNYVNDLNEVNCMHHMDYVFYVK